MDELSSCEFSIRFEIDDRSVAMSSACTYMPEEGRADKGFAFGNCLVEVAWRLRGHLTTAEWESFLLSIGQLSDERERELP
jgi:hypothetical protein